MWPLEDSSSQLQLTVKCIVWPGRDVETGTWGSGQTYNTFRDNISAIRG